MGSLFQLWIVLWNRAAKHRGSPSVEQMTSGWRSGSVAYAFFLIWSGLRKAFTHPAMYFPSISSPLLGSSFSPRFVTVFYIFWPKFCPFLVFAYPFLAWLFMDFAETVLAEEWRPSRFDSFSSLSAFVPPTCADFTGNNSCGAVYWLVPFHPHSKWAPCRWICCAAHEKSWCRCILLLNISELWICVGCLMKGHTKR